MIEKDMWKADIDRCKKCTCGGKRLIVNRTHWLCEEKNRERIGKPLKRPQPMKNFSKKRNSEENRYRELQRRLLTEDSVCHGCGTRENLSFSHLIPRSRRPDLIADERNVVLHCMDYGERKGCHSKWEEGDVTLPDYERNMKAIKQMDLQYYELLRLNRGALK